MMKCSLLSDQSAKTCSEILIYSRDSKNKREVFVLSNLGEIIVITWESKQVKLESMLNLSYSESTFGLEFSENEESIRTSNFKFDKNLRTKGVVSMAVNKISVNGNRQTNLKLGDKKSMLNLLELLYGRNICFEFKGEFLLGVSIIDGTSSLLVGKINDLK